VKQVDKVENAGYPCAQDFLDRSGEGLIRLAHLADDGVQSQHRHGRGDFHRAT
jgi:hypothetical protein